MEIPNYRKCRVRSRLSPIALVTVVLSLAGCGGSSNDDPQLDDPTLPPLVDTSSGPASAEGVITSGEPAEPTEPVGDPMLILPLESAAGAASITEIVLVTGQSNALGAETEYNPSIDTPHPRAFAFTEGGWQVANLNQVWDLGWHPRNDPSTDPSNNFGFQFATKVAERRPDRVIGFVLVSAPGAGISTWDYESEFYVKIRNKVVAAINELPSKATIDGILWHQGETDWADTDYYTSKLNDLIRNFRGESWFGGERPFICADTARSPVNNRLRALNTDDDPWTSCVAAEGLPTKEDDVHFTGEALRIIGARFATRYLQMTDQFGKAQP